MRIRRLHLNIRNRNERVSLFNENFFGNFIEDPTLTYEGAPKEYEDIADYVRRPISEVINA
ncbi:hypothetical protein [Aneurinibacillus aneurinilyticus]|uniref:Uncharacterized protein n=1 Tax=Aneurinibacillus aneurinilyticus TaxID=1391 RepID=A0A848D206_ANEAE|nr:hypothetical protein [Aneurinibacillus aneurinilyticus]NMF00043.1 hypothetical protein [Aneurinibacillus aneurinilyticus]